MLGTVTVWWMPNMVVNTFAFVLSVAMAALVGGLSYKHLSSSIQSHEAAIVSGVVLGFIVLVLAISILAYVGNHFLLRVLHPKRTNKKRETENGERYMLVLIRPCEFP